VAAGGGATFIAYHYAIIVAGQSWESFLHDDFSTASGDQAMSSDSKASMARAAMAAVEPLVEILLEMGVTSPEAESLLRSVFVHQARSWLARLDPNAAAPSDARISLVTGVHRNFVRHILAEPPRIARSRQQKGSRAGRLLNAWHADPQYLDEEGKPRELPEKGHAPSFQSLVSAYLPGTAPGVLLDELKRGGQLQVLPDNRLRVRSRSVRPRGLNLESATQIGERTQELIETMRYNLQHPDERRLFDSLPAIEVAAEDLAAVREIMNRRAMAFLARMEQEVAALARSSKRRIGKNKVRIVLTISAAEQNAEK
jgi:hypothetical protein